MILGRYFEGRDSGFSTDQDSGTGEVTEHGCFQSRGGPQIIHFKRGFHYKPSILGYQYFWFNTHMGHMGGWNGNMEMK